MAMESFIRPRPGPTPKTQPKPTPKPRRPPNPGERAGIFQKSGVELSRFVSEVESSKTYQKLVAEGKVTRLRLRGIVPTEKYQDYMDREFLLFLDTFGIVNVPGWDKDFLSENALSRAHDLAKKYGVPEGTLIRFLRYRRSTSRNGSRSNNPQLSIAGSAVGHGSDATFAPEFSDPTDYMVGESRVDISDVIATAQGFVEKFGLTEQDFLNDILSGELSAREISDLYHCSIREAEEIFAVSEQIIFAETYEASVEPQPSASVPQNRTPAEETPIAHVLINTEDGTLQVDFDNPRRYKFTEVSSPSSEEEATIKSLRYIDELMRKLPKIIKMACDYQIEYLKTGSELRLKPLSKSQVARRLNLLYGKLLDCSQVCRLIRNKMIEIPCGCDRICIYIESLCPSKSDVIRQICSNEEELMKDTDIQSILKGHGRKVKSSLKDEDIRWILEAKYSCKIDRRTVAYHRGKRGPQKRKSSAMPTEHAQFKEM